MKTLKLIALKPHKYGTRHLTAGEEYDAPMREAVALIAIKKAKPIKGEKPAVETSGAKAATPEPQAEPQENIATRLANLREQAAQLGIMVDGRWGISRLQHEIAQVKR